MTTPENPDEGQTPEDTQESTPKKTTRRTRKPAAKNNDADTLKDTQQVVEQAREQLGSSASPGKHLYQTSQFDVQSQNPNVLDHLAHPSEAAVKAQEASDEALRGRSSKDDDK